MSTLHTVWERKIRKPLKFSDICPAFPTRHQKPQILIRDHSNSASSLEAVPLSPHPQVGAPTNQISPERPKGGGQLWESDHGSQVLTWGVSIVLLSYWSAHRPIRFLPKDQRAAVNFEKVTMGPIRHQQKLSSGMFFLTWMFFWPPQTNRQTHTQTFFSLDPPYSRRNIFVSIYPVINLFKVHVMQKSSKIFLSRFLCSVEKSMWNCTGTHPWIVPERLIWPKKNPDEFMQEPTLSSMGQENIRFSSPE